MYLFLPQCISPSLMVFPLSCVDEKIQSSLYHEYGVPVITFTWSSQPGWKLGKLENLRKFGFFFLKIFESEFPILAVGQNRKLGNKKTRNNTSEISKISEVSEFSICHIFIFFLIFFLFLEMFFQDLCLFYLCKCSSKLYKYSSFISLTQCDFMCLCFDLQNAFTTESIKCIGKMKR